jgi:hypothetical protein
MLSFIARVFWALFWLYLFLYKKIETTKKRKKKLQVQELGVSCGIKDHRNKGVVMDITVLKKESLENEKSNEK